MQLAVQQRTVTGKGVKALRKQGLVPCIIYGAHLDSPRSISIDKVQLVKAYNAAGMSTAIQLEGKGIDELVLIHDIQLDPVSDHLMHVDFIAVQKDKKVHAEVPIEFTGVSPFEKSGEGSVQQLRNTLEVEAFPLDLPHEILFDISVIDHDGQVFFVKDLPELKNVTIITDPDQAIANASMFREEAVEEDEIPVLPGEGAEGAEAQNEEDDDE